MKIKKIISVLLVVALIAGVCVIGTISSGASGTGIGLAEWALNAYNSNWSYVYGGATPGAVDCSGLIYSYAGGYRVGDAQTFNSSYRGYLSDGIPNIHGLGLYKPGHVGVYVGGGMAVDARGSQWGVCYESVYSHGWTQYFKVPGVSYPSTGWEKFCGKYYYYENGQYLASTSRTIDGQTYYFDSNGVSSSTPIDGSSSSDSGSSSSSDSGSSSSTTQSNVLKKGSQGDKVEKLQSRLAELGFYQGAVDGDFGSRTELAFKQFQEAAGLYVDGIAGSDMDVLFSDDAPYFNSGSSDADDPEEDAEDETPTEDEELEEVEPEEATNTFKKGDYDEDLIPVQERLIELGYLDGDADGSFGSQTEEAVTGFQGQNNLEKTGEIDEETYDMLFSDTAKKNPEEEKAETPTEAKALTPVASPVAPTTPAKTEVEEKTAELSNKAISGVTGNIGVQQGSGANFEFIIWLAVMIVVMIITFIIVYNVQKKKARAYVGRRYQ